MTFISESDLSSTISQGLLAAMNHTIDRILQENENTIESEVYGTYYPSWYDRTLDFLHAWATKVSGGSGHVEGEMYYDSSKIGIGDAESGQHVSVVNGSSQAGNMPELLYQAGMGCIPRPTNRDAWSELDSILTNRAIRGIFEEGLSASGMPWKRKTGAITVTKTR